ncbi:MAG: DUF4388 domain-containing protein [Candidatus Coatesbacteria bacterium]|nr:MAG: DUF4388 domain-containing protein [Candidatus Coatesbacteria bacterium]
MSIEGDIADFSLEEVMQVIGQGRKTGTLAVEGTRETIWVYYKEGKAVFATPSNLREQLGTILVREGAISEEQLELALRTQKRMRAEGNPIRLGMILVAMGAIDRELLDGKIRHQIKESIYAAIGERAGRFRFFPDLDLQEEDILVSMDVQQIILEGARRIEEWSQIKDVIQSYSEVYAINPNPTTSGAINLTSPEWKVLSLLDGRRHLSAIAEAAALTRFDVCRIVFALLNMNIIRPVGDGADEPAIPHAAKE